MKLYINGVDVDRICETKTTPTKEEECKLYKKYPATKSWCDLIAFLINCNFLAFNVEQRFLTGEDILKSHPTGELYLVFNAIDMIKNTLNGESNVFTKLCFNVLDGKITTPDKKYASNSAILLHKHIFR